MERIDLAVGDLVFDALADGPAAGDLVLLLHGFPESAAEWTHVLPRLAGAGYRAVAPNQRGYAPGARPAGVAQYHIDHLVADVVGLADGLGADRFHLVGHDWGALVAWAFADRYPERLRSLTIVSVPHPQPFAAARATDPDQQARSTYIQGFKDDPAAADAFLADDAALLKLALAEAGPEILAEHLRVLTDPGALDAGLDWYRAWDDALDGTGVVTVPTLYVWSDDDVALGRLPAEQTGDFVSGPYTFVVIEGVSHWIPEVVPDRLSDLILDHIAGR
ncbi:MAG: alpha/beta hydrolase [Actinobacteria bacterium]|nr:alpha/beta hydrolase [Actinomycetota bacterium]